MCVCVWHCVLCMCMCVLCMCVWECVARWQLIRQTWHFCRRCSNKLQKIELHVLRCFAPLCSSSTVGSTVGCTGKLRQLIKIEVAAELSAVNGATQGQAAAGMAKTQLANLLCRTYKLPRPLPPLCLPLPTVWVVHNELRKVGRGGASCKCNA